MVREDTTLARLVVTASVLLNAALLAVVGAMATSDHAAAKIAPRLHLAHEQQLAPIRKEVQSTHAAARGAQAHAAATRQFIEDLRAEIDTAVRDLGEQVIGQNVVVDEIKTSVEEAQNFTSLRSVNESVNDLYQRLARLEERMDALCARRAC